MRMTALWNVQPPTEVCWEQDMGKHASRLFDKIIENQILS